MSQLDLFSAPSWRTSDPATSRDAAVLNLPNRGAHQALALAALRAAGEVGLTDFELELETGVKQTSIGKRRLELLRAGLVEPRMVVDPDSLRLVQDRRRAPSGASALVWVAS